MPREGQGSGLETKGSGKDGKEIVIATCTYCATQYTAPNATRMKNHIGSYKHVPPGIALAYKNAGATALEHLADDPQPGV